MIAGLTHYHQQQPDSLLLDNSTVKIIKKKSVAKSLNRQCCHYLIDGQSFGLCEEVQ